MPRLGKIIRLEIRDASSLRCGGASVSYSAALSKVDFLRELP